MSTTIVLNVPEKVEFVYFTPHLVVAKHLIMGWRIRSPEHVTHAYIEVTLINGSTVSSEYGYSDVPAFVRKQLGGIGADLTCAN